MNSRDKDMDITLPLLQTIDAQHDISQRRLAERLGVALGLANSFIKNCIKKGLIKVEQIPANRYLYYLTPQGFAEKSRLTARYLSNQFTFYRAASAACRKCFAYCHEKKWQEVMLAGVNELAEIAMVQAVHENIQILGIFDSDYEQPFFLQMKVYDSLSKIPENTVMLITDLQALEQYKEIASLSIKIKHILIPQIL